MTPLLQGLLLAVVASFALNASYLLQHLGGVSVPAVDVRRPLATIRGLLRSRLWVIGTVTGLVGSLLHAGALAQAPLSLVQAFSAAGLAVLIPLAARCTGMRLHRVERIGVAVIVVALAALAVAPAAAATTVPSFWLPVGIAVGAVGIAAAGHRRPVLLGVATGTLYAVADASIKAFAAKLHVGLMPALMSPWPALFLATCAVAFFAFQRALQTGRAVTVIAAMAGATNLVAVAVGLVVFGESLGTSLPVLVLHAGAMLAIGAGAWWLVRAQARLADCAALPGAHPAPAA